MKLKQLGMIWCSLGTACFLTVQAADGANTAKVKSASVEGQFDGDKGRLVIQADLQGLGEGRERSVYGAAFEETVKVTRDKVTTSITVKVEAIQGGLREIVLSLAGDGEIQQVSGEGLEDWGVRQSAGSGRFLVVRLKKADKPITSFTGQVVGEATYKDLPALVSALTLNTEQTTLANGYVRIEADPQLSVQVTNVVGIIPMEAKYLPPKLRPADGSPESLAFRFHGTAYQLPLSIGVADPEARQVALTGFALTGRIEGEGAGFDLVATARVKNPRGGTLDLLQGGIALSEIQPIAGARVRFREGRFQVEFDKAGEFPLKVHFQARVTQNAGWNEIAFRVAPAALQPVVLEGLKADTQFRFGGAARPERKGEQFTSFLPPTGQMTLAWKEGRPEAEGKLFYAVETLSQISVSSGLMQQAALFDVRVMQGELNRLVLLMHGEGEVTKVQGPSVLSWNVEPGDGPSQRRLVVQFNAPQKDQVGLSVHLQRPLGAFPQSVDATQLVPDGATRFGGYVRLVNEGAVRLEVLQATGLSQISPEQIPQTDSTKALLPPQSTQKFAYRFSGADHQLRLQADNILPEVSVSQVLSYHLGETELAIEVDLELDIREAPLRESLLRIPKGFVIARINATGLSDYFVTDSPEGGDAQLRIVYSAPQAGRQVMQLRLERNQPFKDSKWALPRLEVVKAKSVRGHVGVSADAGFRLSPANLQGVTEVATAFFPQKRTGLQAAFRLNDPGWQVAINVERLPQTIQADCFHLFSVGEGIAYGSSVMNYLVSGSPVSLLRVELSDEYVVEFTGKNVRSWQKSTNGYEVQLHTPVSGSYTLLATYERPFKRQGEKLTFTGARPLDAQSEQGHSVVVSAYQFQVQPVTVSGTLTPLEPGEVPAEYRLLFDAPVLAAYRYASRPFNLELALKPMAQGAMVSQVVDRALLTTRISQEGQIVTDARYFVKNKGTPNLRLVIPDGAELWSVTVNSNSVVPVKDQRANLVPLPQNADPNTVNEVQIKLAFRAAQANRIAVVAPIVSAPVLLAEWELDAAPDRRLVYRTGTLTPVSGRTDSSGFAGLMRLLRGGAGGEVLAALVASFALLAVLSILVDSMRKQGVRWLSTKHVMAGCLMVISSVASLLLLCQVLERSTHLAEAAPTGLRFVAPVQQVDSVLRLDILNVKAGVQVGTVFWALLPALCGVGVWIYGWLGGKGWGRTALQVIGWALTFWGILRLPRGTPCFFGLVCVFALVEVIVPAVREW